MNRPSEDSGRGCQWVLARHRAAGPALGQATAIVRARLGVARRAPATQSRGTQRCWVVITATRGSRNVSTSDEIWGGRQSPLRPQPGERVSAPRSWAPAWVFSQAGPRGGDCQCACAETGPLPHQGHPARWRTESLPAPPAGGDPRWTWRSVQRDGTHLGTRGRCRALGRPECRLGRTRGSSRGGRQSLWQRAPRG